MARGRGGRLASLEADEVNPYTVAAKRQELGSTIRAHLHAAHAARRLGWDAVATENIRGAQAAIRELESLPRTCLDAST
jgi:hypothetical protein